jgi:hypothetical protein
MQNTMKGRIQLFFFVSSLLFSLVPFGLAATDSRVYLEKTPDALEGGISVKVLVDSNEPLNAYSLELRYDSNLLSLEDIDVTRSLVDIWKAKGEDGDVGIVRFEGADFSSFSGSKGEIAELRFVSRGKGNAAFYFSEASVYLADGNGTKIIPKGELLSLFVGDSPSESISSRPSETGASGNKSPFLIPPSIEKNPFDETQKLITFQVDPSKTKETLVRSRSFFSWSEWRRIENPVPVLANIWSAEVQMIDTAGNIYKEIVYDWEFFIVYRFSLIVFLFAFLFVIHRIFFRQKPYNK